MRWPRFLVTPWGFALGAMLALLFPMPAALSAEARWEVQGEMQLSEILDRIETAVEEQANTQSEFKAMLTEISAAMQAEIEEMREAGPGTPRYRIAKSEWADLMSRKVSTKLAWAQGNVERSRSIGRMIERALGLIDGLLRETMPGPERQSQLDEARAGMVRIGAHIGLLLHEATPQEDRRTQATLRSVMQGLTALQKERHSSATGATSAVYLRLNEQLSQLLSSSADLLARNRLEVRRNRVDGERLEAMIVRDLASMNVRRLEEYTRVLATPDFMLPNNEVLRANADDFAEIERLEAAEESGREKAVYPGDTRQGFARLLRGGAR